MAVVQRFVLGHSLLKWEEAWCLSHVCWFRKLSKGWDFREIWGLAWKDLLFHWEPNHCSANCKVLNQEECVALNCSAEQWFLENKTTVTRMKTPTNKIIFISAMAALWTENGMFCFAGLVCRKWLYPVADKNYIWALEEGKGGWEDLCLQNHWCRKMQVLCCV